MKNRLLYLQYNGPISVEWEDSGMEKVFGANIAFDDALKTD